MELRNITEDITRQFFTGVIGIISIGGLTILGLCWLSCKAYDKATGRKDDAESK